VGRHFSVLPQSSPAEVIATCRLNYDGAKIDKLLAELRQIAGHPQANKPIALSFISAGNKSARWRKRAWNSEIILAPIQTWKS
jgi:hypothetical protein